MYDSPNKSLELAALLSSLMTEMGRTKSGHVTKEDGENVHTSQPHQR